MAIDIKVFRGLTITVERGNVCPAEPDVGIPSKFVEDFTVTHIGGRPCKKPPHWLYNKLDNDEKEKDRVFEALNDELRNTEIYAPYERQDYG